jgi:hypothetical protein
MGANSVQPGCNAGSECAGHGGKTDVPQRSNVAPRRLTPVEQDNYYALVVGDPGYVWFSMEERVLEEGTWLMAIPLRDDESAFLIDISEPAMRFRDPYQYDGGIGLCEDHLRAQTSSLLMDVLATTPLLIPGAPLATALTTRANQDTDYLTEAPQSTKFRRIESGGIGSVSRLFPWTSGSEAGGTGAGAPFPVSFPSSSSAAALTSSALQPPCPYASDSGPYMATGREPHGGMAITAVQGGGSFDRARLSASASSSSLMPLTAGEAYSKPFDPPPCPEALFAMGGGEQLSWERQARAFAFAPPPFTPNPQPVQVIVQVPPYPGPAASTVGA